MIVCVSDIPRPGSQASCGFSSARRTAAGSSQTVYTYMHYIYMHYVSMNEHIFIHVYTCTHTYYITREHGGQAWCERQPRPGTRSRDAHKEINMHAASRYRACALVVAHPSPSSCKRLRGGFGARTPAHAPQRAHLHTRQQHTGCAQDVADRAVTWSGVSVLTSVWTFIWTASPSLNARGATPGR